MILLLKISLFHFVSREALCIILYNFFSQSFEVQQNCNGKASPLQECLFLSYRLIVKNPPANAGDTKDKGSVSGSGRSSGGGNGNPLQYSCLENFMDRGSWQATVHVVAKSRTLSEHTHTYTATQP